MSEPSVLIVPSLWLPVLLLAALVWNVLPAQAQLISPGKLSRAHQDLEGILNCTSCHALGSQGSDDQRCLSCHTPLKTRIEARRGFHASVADQNCGTCHKEHFGATFDLVRMDTTRFDHAETGFELTGAHTKASCRNCHRPDFITASDVRGFKGRHDALDRTFLGLATRCLVCHESKDPHAGQFEGEDCATCHVADKWEDASRFDHDKARFRLVGKHRQATCRGCHTPAQAPDGTTFIRYSGVASDDCATCHEDAHSGAFGVDCQRCHEPAGWHQIRNFAEQRFDHATTGFDLLGKHARLDCASCHARSRRADDPIRMTFVRGTEGYTYPKIRVTDCLSCHTDEHRGAFAKTPGGIVCENCHTQEAWFPATYDLDRHNAETRYALEGAHLATPCSACHHAENKTPTFRFGDLACASCHAPDNPHGAQFADETGATDCASCHGTGGWTVDLSFDHATTRYPLTGRHATAACASCHASPAEGQGVETRQYRGLATDCKGCHSDDDPHQGQFQDPACDACHDTEGFRPVARSFDHSRTRFVLAGAHLKASCGACHRTETAPDGDRFVRYRPLGIACKDCHSNG